MVISESERFYFRQYTTCRAAAVLKVRNVPPMHPRSIGRVPAGFGHGQKNTIAKKKNSITHARTHARTNENRKPVRPPVTCCYSLFARARSCTIAENCGPSENSPVLHDDPLREKRFADAPSLYLHDM